MSSLFTASDPDGDTITQYRFWDGTADPNSGHVVVNGVAQGKDTYITVTPQPADADHIPGRHRHGSDVGSGQRRLQWGSLDDLQHQSAGQSYRRWWWRAMPQRIGGQVLQASSLFTASDPDGDTITQYRFWDGTADPEQRACRGERRCPGQGYLHHDAAGQLAQTTFQAGTASDQMWVQANDGAQWGAWTIFNINPAAGGYQAPAIVASGATLELTSAYSGTVTFAGPTGTLKLDQSASFTGKIGGQLAIGDVIDLTDITAGAGATIGYSGNNSPGTLTVGDGTRTANIALLGNYSLANFTPSSDGHNGTSVVDPPLSNSSPDACGRQRIDCAGRAPPRHAGRRDVDRRADRICHRRIRGGVHRSARPEHRLRSGRGGAGRLAGDAGEPGQRIDPWRLGGVGGERDPGSGFRRPGNAGRRGARQFRVPGHGIAASRRRP